MRRAMRTIGSLLGLGAAAMLASPILSVGAGAQAPAHAPATSPAPVESNRKTSTPYAGDTSIFEASDRAEKLHVERVMDILAIHAGSSVADIGAGSGWFTVRAARRAGGTGRVFAVDINKAYLEAIEKRARAEHDDNVVTVLGAEDDPRLPASSVDAVLVLKTYHEIARPVTLMSKLRPALRAGALVGIIDREGKGDDHGVESSTVVAEMARAGFELSARYDFVKDDGMDYFLVFHEAGGR